MNRLTPEEIKALKARDKVLYSRAVKLGLVVDISEAERKLTPTLKALQDKVKGLSDSLDKEHPLFSKSKLGHTITAISGLVKGIRGSQEGLDSAHKSLDKLGLGWISNTSHMIQWAITAKNNKELGKELYDNMGLLGKAMVNVSEFLGKKAFKIDFNLDESEAEKKLREQKAELEEVIKKKKETLDVIEGLYKESADSRLQIIKDTIQKEIDLLNESPLLKDKPAETESKTQVSKKLQESEQIKTTEAHPVSTEVDESILKQKRELLDQLSSMYKESGDDRLKVLTDQVQSELDVFNKISTPKKISPVEVGDETQANLSKLQDGIDSVDMITKSLGKDMTSTESAASKALGNISSASEGTAGSLAGTANTAAKLGATTETSMAGATKAMAMFGTTAAVASAGILLVAGALAAIVVGFMKVTEIAILARDEMVKFDRVFGGIGETSLFEFRKQLNGISDDLGHLGVTTEVVNDIVHKYLTSGISLARSTSSALVGATKEVAEITGQSTEAIGGFFSNLIKKVNLTDNSLRQLSTSFINYNKAAHAVKGVAISFDLFKESIESSTNALMIAKSKGESFVKAMSSDLASLAGLASTIGLNVSELNSRFEEAGNLINNMSSGFRSLLVISGGTNIDQMMSNTFDKTEAILKISEYIQNLNTQFGGNLNITSQVVSQIGGISKEMALQLARLTTEERRRMSDMIKFKQAMKDDTVTDDFNKITNNLTAAWDKVKAAFINVFQKAITKSEVLSKFVEKLSNLANYLRDQLTGESMSDFMKGMTNIIDKIAGPFSKLVDKVKDFVVDLGDPNKSWLSSLWELIKSAGRAIVDILLESASQFGTLVMRGMLLAAGRSGSMFGKSAQDIAEGDLKAEGISVETLTKQNFDYLGGNTANILDAATIANNANLMAKQQYDEILKKRISDIESENARKPKATQTEQKVSQVTTQENQQKQKEVEALNKLTSSLEKNISWNEDLIKSYTNLGLVDTDIAYGRTFDSKTGEWGSEEGFMSVGERKEQLQKEIDYRENQKVELMKQQADNTTKLVEQSAETNKLLKLKLSNGREIQVEDGQPLPPANRPSLIPANIWKAAQGTTSRGASGSW